MLTIKNNFLFNKKTKKVKEMNVIPDKLIFDFQESLKQIKGKNVLKITDTENINYKKTDLNQIIELYKKNDQTWYLTSIINKMLKLNSKYQYDQYKQILILSKYISLYCSIQINQISNIKLGLLESLIIYSAYNYSQELGKNFEIIFKERHEIDFKNINFIKSQLTKNEIIKTSINLSLYSSIFEEIDNLLENSLNMIKLSSLFAEYQILKNETYTFLKKPKKSKSFVNEENYNEISSIQLLITDEVYKLSTFINRDQVEQIISIITEMDLQVHLSDMPAMGFADWIGLFIRYALLIFWAIVIIYPIVILVKQSFNGKNEKVILNIQEFVFTFDVYKRLFTQTLYLRWLTNSVLIAFFTMIFTIFIVSLTAYAFSRFKYRGKHAFLIALLVTQMIPSFTSVLVYYILTELLNLAFAIPLIVTLMFIYIGGGVASNTVILKGYMDSISQDIDDAARIDGCSHFWIYLNIIMPLCKPMIVLIALMSFIGPFGDVILPQIILKNQEDYTVAVGLNMFINSGRLMDYPGYFAGSTLVAAPIVVLFIGLQKYVVSGLTTGGVKG